jgi:hypothetical protein
MNGLTPAERRRLAELADALVPAGDGMPAASHVGVHGSGADRVLALRPDLLAPVRRALATGASVEELRRTDGEAFAALTSLVAAAYLTEPGVQRRLGYPGAPEGTAGCSDAEVRELRELVRGVQARGRPG